MISFGKSLYYYIKQNSLESHIEGMMQATYELNKDNDDVDVDVVIAFDNITNRMSDNINKILVDIFIFWKQIKNEKDGVKINETSENISKKMRLLRDDFIEMEQSCKSFNIALMELYINFLGNVIYNRDEEKEYAEKLKIIKKSIKFTTEDPNLIVNKDITYFIFR